ncbi:MAG: glyoxalase/bleomycin resistance protein/dioxygenase [Pseudonocardia sp.]|nr:glyoxalase/bleomycin resistance protein/dioxygenase [Pseudonocardia sp.]
MALAIGMVTTDCADPKGLATFWAAALSTTISGDYGAFVMLAPPPAGGPVLAFQLVPEGRTGKNRLHLDLVAPPGQRDAEVARLMELGATVLGERGGDAEGLVWTTLADPEGNEFCVAEH